MSTALAMVSSMNEAPLDSEFPCHANVVPRDLVKSRASLDRLSPKIECFCWNIRCTPRLRRNDQNDHAPTNALHISGNTCISSRDIDL